MKETLMVAGLCYQKLTEAIWRAMLSEAYDCLDADKDHRGRAKQLVTLEHSGESEMYVSPHLNIHTHVWSSIPIKKQDAVSMLKGAFNCLTPIHNFVEKQSGDT